MKLVKLAELFDVRYGTNLELNALTESDTGINFVSRTAKNNGVSAKVAPVPSVAPIPAGVLTVAGGGSVLETFLQPEPFYSGRDLFYLVPKIAMSDAQKLYYAKCITANKYRYNYGRQANKTLRELLVPAVDELPKWLDLSTIDLSALDAKASTQMTPLIDVAEWGSFRYDELFEIVRGKGPRIHELTGEGSTPFVTSIESNNGVTAFTTMSPTHPGNVLTVNRNGSVAEAFYQPRPFCSTEDVHVFLPKFEMNAPIGLFIATLIRQERYRYSYGRKWGLSRMNASVLRLPITADGSPDYPYMERYIRTLPFSSQLDA